MSWLKLYREIQDHWVWQNDKYLKWWLTIILNVNYEPKKFPVGTELFVCNPGQSFRSIEQWTAMFSCSKPTTLKFFEMLKNDGMIKTEIVGKGNRRKHLLTLVNWAKYQKTETGNFTETVPETLPKINPNVPPNNNIKNLKNNIEVKQSQIQKLQKEFYDSLKPFVSNYPKMMLRNFFEYWTEPNASLTKIRWQMEKTWDTSKRLKRWADNDKNKEPQETRIKWESTI